MLVYHEKNNQFFFSFLINFLKKVISRHQAPQIPNLFSRGVLLCLSESYKFRRNPASVYETILIMAPFSMIIV